jgi:hypothetical protein
VALKTYNFVIVEYYQSLAEAEAETFYLDKIDWADHERNNPEDGGRYSLAR